MPFTQDGKQIWKKQQPKVQASHNSGTEEGNRMTGKKKGFLGEGGEISNINAEKTTAPPELTKEYSHAQK